MVVQHGRKHARERGVTPKHPTDESQRFSAKNKIPTSRKENNAKQSETNQTSTEEQPPDM